MNLSYSNSIVIIIPIYNDWESFLIIVNEIDVIASQIHANLHLIAVNDGSFQTPSNLLNKIQNIKNIKSFELLHLFTNIGHQRAIAIGLVEVSQSSEYDAVIIMDADGEDRPGDLGRLIDEFLLFRDEIIVAQRTRRSEGALFYVFYKIYQTLFLLLIGKSIDFGNYCLIPRKYIKSLTYDPNIWNHLASTLVDSRYPLRRIKTLRGKRYSGHSSMNLESLITHGLSAVSVHIDKILVKILLLLSLLLILAIFGIIIVGCIRFYTALAIPGWATNSIGLLIIFIFQLIILSAGVSFSVLSQRASHDFTPAIDAQKYIEKKENLSNNEER